MAVWLSSSDSRAGWAQVGCGEAEDVFADTSGGSAATSGGAVIMPRASQGTGPSSACAFA